MYERFTDKARQVIELAEQEAKHLHHEYIGTEHLLLGLVKGELNVAIAVLGNLEVDAIQITQVIDEIAKPLHEDTSRLREKLPLTPRVKRAIELAMEEARNFGHNYVGTEHLLLGLLREEEGVAAQILKNQDLKLEYVREEVLRILGRPGQQDNKD